MSGWSVQQGELVLERENFRHDLEPRADRGPTRGSRAMNSAIIVPEEGINLRPATDTATTRGDNTYRTFSRDRHSRPPSRPTPPAPEDAVARSDRAHDNIYSYRKAILIQNRSWVTVGLYRE